MDMIKGVRVPERAYRGVLWLVSIVFAAFIVGLGNLVIGDLPLVDQQVMAEQERRRHVSHEEAFKKVAAKICPGCDRPTATTGDAEANFCIHCGMTLYDRCTTCETRKMAFFRYCMTCGTPAEPPEESMPAVA